MRAREEGEEEGCPPQQTRKPQDPPEALGEGEGTETLGENAGTDFVGSSPSPAPLCETSLCIAGSVADEDGRRTVSKELVQGGAGGELPALLDAAWASDTGTVLLSPPLGAITELGVLVRGVSGRRPPVAEVPSAEKGQSKMDLYTLSYKQVGVLSSITTLRLTAQIQRADDPNVEEKLTGEARLSCARRGCSQEDTLQRALGTSHGSAVGFASPPPCSRCRSPAAGIRHPW